QPAHVFASPDIIGKVLPVTIDSLERYSLLGELASTSSQAMPSVPSPAIDPSPLIHSSQKTMGA
ncbi:MAG: hypothetical protein C0480_29045, partial [Bradyrhizobium sp.]|nr:hypothetical protein [Bradyrhizobium sp.]